MHLDGQINQQIRATKALIRTKFDLVKANDIYLCDPDVVPQVEMSLRVLHEIFRLVNKDLILVDHITNKDLTKDEYNALIEKVGELIVNTSARVDSLKADLFVKKAALEEALDTTGNSSLDDSAISAVDSSPVQALTGPPKGASAAVVPTTGASRLAATAMPQAVSATFNPTTILSCIPSIFPILVKP